jgi:hypothetical protein
MSTESFTERLSTLWEQGGRDLAVTFLRRATTLDNTLEEVLAALKFDAVRPYLSDIKLLDIFPPAAARVHQDATPQVLPARRKRQRRSADEMRQMKARLLMLLREEPGSLDTVQMMNTLNEEGHGVDTIVVNSLLKGLEIEGDIVNLGGKPKAWRATPVGRTSAEPPIIKRAHE